MPDMLRAMTVQEADVFACHLLARGIPYAYDTLQTRRWLTHAGYQPAQAITLIRARQAAPEHAALLVQACLLDQRQAGEAWYETSGETVVQRRF
jgi:hypothetical protein